MKNLVLNPETGRQRPAVPRPPVLSSADAPWTAVYVEQFGGGPCELRNETPLQHLIFVQLDRPSIYQWDDQGRSVHVQVPPGHVTLLPAGQACTAGTPDTGDFLSLALEPGFVAGAGEMAQAERAAIVGRRAVKDPLVRGLALALKAEIEAGYPGGRWYGESLAHTLGVHLVRHYSIEKPARVRREGIAPHQLRRAIAFIHEHLAEDLPLSALAAVAGLSPFHFARLFKAATGLAPHQYLIQQRVERAKELLLEEKASLATIALRVGFCDQSHLTSHFKRIYGRTPKAFADAREDRSPGT